MELARVMLCPSPEVEFCLREKLQIFELDLIHIANLTGVHLSFANVILNVAIAK